MVDTSLSQLEARLASLDDSPEHAAQRVDILTELAWQLRTHDTPRANALASQARELARERGDILGQARATRTMAMTISDVDSVGMVFELGEEAVRLFDEASDDVGRAASRDFMASLHEHVGDYGAGLQMALDALSIARALDDPIRQGYALSSVGGILAAAGEADAGIEHLEEALALFEGVGDADGVATICSRLAKVMQAAGRHEEALRYAETRRDIAEQSGDEVTRLFALSVMAEVEHERGHLAEAEALYRSALDPAYLGEPVRTILGVSAQVALARVLTERGSLDEAERELTDALRRTEGESVSVVSELAAHEALAELRERQDQLAAAIEHMRAAQALRAQIAEQEARNKLAQVEARAAMEAAKKDAEIHKLRYVELHGMQAQLVEAEKMALLGKLAAGTAHELNTPLGVLRSNLELSETATQRLLSLVRGQADLEARASKLASALESSRATTDEAIGRIASIARSFSRFTQLDQAERRTFDVRESLKSALALLEPTTPDDVVWERRFDEVPSIEGRPRELNHAFLTVLRNAAEAIDGAGVVTVEVTASDDELLVRVQDTGRGMSEEQVAHLFDVAWSEEGRRTTMRLGLSAAYTTMQTYGGALEVHSVEGEGTTVTFRFPLARQRSAAAG